MKMSIAKDFRRKSLLTLLKMLIDSNIRMTHRQGTGAPQRVLSYRRPWIVLSVL
jgi:hypothetical protein